MNAEHSDLFDWIRCLVDPASGISPYGAAPHFEEANHGETVINFRSFRLRLFLVIAACLPAWLTLLLPSAERGARRIAYTRKAACIIGAITAGVRDLSSLREKPLPLSSVREKPCFSIDIFKQASYIGVFSIRLPCW